MTKTQAFQGTVEGETLYREDELMRRMGWGRHAITEARKRGLQVNRAGKRNYYLGRNVIQYVIDQTNKPEAVEA